MSKAKKKSNIQTGMSDIAKFRLIMIIWILVSCGLFAPLLIPVWIYAEIKKATME